MHTKAFFAYVLLGLAILLTHLSAQAAGVSINAVDFSSLPGDKVQILIKGSGNLPQPTSFTTDNPARLAVDFDGVSSALPKMSQAIGIGMARSILALEAGSRTRLIINLVGTTPFEIQTRGNESIITLAAGANVAPVKTASAPSPAAAPRPAPAQKATAPRPAVAQQPSPTRPPVTRGAKSIQNIDFRRGNSGEGRLLVTLTDPNTVADMRQEGGFIVIDFMNTTIPSSLMRKLDVTDFATPVKSIETIPDKSNTRISIKADGLYEHLAYQTDNNYVVELRPLTEKEAEQRSEKSYTGERLSLNFQDIEVRSVLQLLADFTGLNLVVSDTVNGNITLRLQNVPWDQALDIILKTKGLSMRKKDSVVMIAPTEEIAAREKLELESQKQIEELAPLHAEWFRLNFAKAEDFATLLKKQDNPFLSERGSITFDTRTNTLLVKDTEAKLEDIRRLLKKLDIPVRQVLIESRIVIANDDFTRDIGVKFGASGVRYGDNTQNTDSYFAVGGGVAGDMAHAAGTFFENEAGSGNEALLVNLPATSPTGAINFVLGKVASHLIRLELSAMQSEGKGEIISSPRVITSDQTKATIKQGMQIPYQEASSSGATSVAFKDAVLKMEVTPQITPDDQVIMNLVINKDSPDWSREVNGTPPLDTREIQTNVLVDNGETVVLGGIFERTKAESVNKIPVLGDLPYMGALFRNKSTQDDNSELLIFITPKILKSNLAKR